MKRSVVLFILVSLILGVVGGYSAGYLKYEPKIRSFRAQVSALTSEVSSLSQTVASQATQISTLESEKSGLQVRLSSAQLRIMDYERQLVGVKADLSSVTGRLDRILRVRVTQYYDWAYRGSTWKWELPIPLSTYVEFMERPRPKLGIDYADMARDAKDDLYIDRMVQGIDEAARQSNYNAVQKLNFIVAFIQSLPYTVDNVTTPYNEYPRYPVETLFDRGGDCEDTSILAAALFDRLGYDVALLLLRDARHMAVGVSLSGTYGSYYEYLGKKYFYLETTGDGFEIGVIPSSITDTRAEIYPLRR